MNITAQVLQIKEYVCNDRVVEMYNYFSFEKGGFLLCQLFQIPFNVG